MLTDTQIQFDRMARFAKAHGHDVRPAAVHLTPSDDLVGLQAIEVRIICVWPDGTVGYTWELANDMADLRIVLGY